MMSGRLKLSKRDIEELAKVKLALEEKLDAPPLLKELCRRSGLNADKLKRGFRHLFGNSPYAYHLQFKMEAAKKMLRETDMPVKEIAWELGYEHPGNFCYQFKKVTGVRAGVWRGEQVTL